MTKILCTYQKLLEPMIKKTLDFGLRIFLSGSKNRKTKEWFIWYDVNKNNI